VGHLGLLLVVVQSLGLPGPWGVPFLHNFFEITEHKDRIYDWFTENTLKVRHVLMSCTHALAQPLRRARASAV
jgi:hypothetical protein